MKDYLATYKGTAQELSGMGRSAPYEIKGSVEFNSGETDDSELIRLADDTIRAGLKDLFAPIWTIERLVAVERVIK